MKDASDPDYGNWVSKKLIARMFIMSAVFGGASAAAFIFLNRTLAVGLGVLLALMASFFLTAALYFIYARWLFSDAGGGIQKKILETLISKIRWDGNGTVLDIGCGSGTLAVMLAKKYPQAHITGVDHWGGSWGYGQAQCEKNASLGSVAERADFISASASNLPFADGAFDLAVSNLVFHEVKDSRDKREPLREALRIVKKGGTFAFQDLFALKTYYGTTGELLGFIKSCGIKEVHYEDTSRSPFIPRALGLPFMTGALGLVYGIK